MDVWVCTVCAFLVKADSVVNTKGRYVGRYKERLAQQESGAALSKSSIYVSWLLFYKECALIRPWWIALQQQLGQRQRVFNYCNQYYVSTLGTNTILPSSGEHLVDEIVVYIT